MKISIITQSILAVFLVGSVQTAVADSEQHGQAEHGPLQVIAQTILKLNHYPDTSEKKSLNEIINNHSTSDAERSLATALLNMQHKVAGTDKQNLTKLIKDKSLPEKIRQMAEILSNINHKPSKADKIQLRNILDHK